MDENTRCHLVLALPLYILTYDLIIEAALPMFMGNMDDVQLEASVY